MKKVAVCQSNYIPWKGYFDMIAAVSHFIILDDVQYTKNDWRNRNIIKGPNGLQWLTIPTGKSISRSIKEVAVSSPKWRRQHWNALQSAYGRAPHFSEICGILEPLYFSSKCSELSVINQQFMQCIMSYLGITTEVRDSCDFAPADDPSERLVNICREVGADVYLSGPAARRYLDVSKFSAAKVKVEWMDYTGYPEYVQMWGEFEHNVSILDLLFNCGRSSRSYLKYVDRDPVMISAGASFDSP